MTHAYLGLAAFDLGFTAVGYALLVCLGFVRGAKDALRFAGLAFFGGWATLAVVLSLGVTVGLDPDLPRVLAVEVALIAVFAAARRAFPPVPRRLPPGGGSPLALAGAFAGGALVVLTVAVALIEATKASADMSWDTWYFWLPKGMAIYYFHGLDTGLSGYTSYPNPEYPPLVPVMDAASFHFLGGVYPMLLPLQQCLLFAGFVASVVALLDRVPRWILFPTLAMLVLAPQLWRQLFTVLPDETLAYLLALAAIAGILWLEDRGRAWLVLAVIFLAAAALTKSEGAMLGLLLATVLVAAGFVRRGRRALEGLLLLLGPLALEPWRLWLAAHHRPVSASVYSWTSLFHPGYLEARTARLTYAVGHMVNLLRDPDSWSPILPLTLAVLIVFAPRLGVVSAAFGTWIVVGFAGLATVYWIGTLDVGFYVTTSAYRVVADLSIVAGAVLPLLLGIALEHEPRTISPPEPAATAASP